MSTKTKKLSASEIELAFGKGAEPAVHQLLTTKEALNVWKNAGLLEGTYRQRRGQDRYWRDRLVACFFNGLDWNETTKQERKEN
jgi:hypothetical protein